MIVRLLLIRGRGGIEGWMWMWVRWVHSQDIWLFMSCGGWRDDTNESYDAVTAFSFSLCGLWAWDGVFVGISLVR